MSTPLDPVKLTLVRKAITCGLRNCCEWKDQAVRRFLAYPIGGLTLTAAEVRAQLIQHVTEGGEVIQIKEEREEYKDEEYYYKVILPVSGLRRGLFVELVLTDDDPDLPEVRIVNVHEQRA